MKNTIKIVAAVSGVLVSSTALGVAGLDRLTFTPSFLFEKGNYAELSLARADPTVRTTFDREGNVAEIVDTLKFAYKHQINDKFGLGLMVNNQPIGVDVNYAPIGSALRASLSARSHIALGHLNVTDKISVYGGANYHTQKANADLTPNGAPGATKLDKDSDIGFIVGGAYSIPKIALRASLTYESDMSFSHKTTNSNPVVNNSFSMAGNSTAATPEAITLELQSGIAKDTLLFGSVRRSSWSDAQVKLLGTTQLSDFDDTTVYKLGIGRKFSDSISGSITFNYESANGKPSSPLSPQDGERGVAVGLKFTAKDGFTTSVGAQYRELGDTTTTASSGALPFKDNHVVTLGVKFSKSF